MSSLTHSEKYNYNKLTLYLLLKTLALFYRHMQNNYKVDGHTEGRVPERTRNEIKQNGSLLSPRELQTAGRKPSCKAGANIRVSNRLSRQSVLQDKCSS